MTPTWLFRPFAPNDRARNSQVEKFFKSDILQNRPTAVVREGIQNSLDARHPDASSVHIRIAIGTIPASTIPLFVAELSPG